MYISISENSPDIDFHQITLIYQFDICIGASLMLLNHAICKNNIQSTCTSISSSEP